MGLSRELVKREVLTSDAYIHTHPTFSLRVYLSLTKLKAKKIISMTRVRVPETLPPLEGCTQLSVS